MLRALLPIRGLVESEWGAGLWKELCNKGHTVNQHFPTALCGKKSMGMREWDVKLKSMIQLVSKSNS